MQRQIFENILEQFGEPQNGYRRLRDYPEYGIIFKQFSKMFSRELACYLLDRMSRGDMKASFLLTDLFKERNQPIPIEVFVLKEHSGNDRHENYMEERNDYCEEKGIERILGSQVDSMFRADRISNSEWFSTISFPEDTSIISGMQNLNI
jgi:hypothetical protein